jgi:hypothetical protein
MILIVYNHDTRLIIEKPPEASNRGASRINDPNDTAYPPMRTAPDSALHTLSGCQHTKMRNMIISRHNTASVLNLQRDHAEPMKLPTLT